MSRVHRLTAIAMTTAIALRPTAARGEGIPSGPTPPANTIDPRVPVASIGVGLPTAIPLYGQLKYPSRSSPIPNREKHNPDETSARYIDRNA